MANVKWGLLLQGTLCWLQLRMATSKGACPYITRVTGLIPFQIVIIMIRAFFPCMLFLQQIHMCLERLLATGKWGHFRFASSEESILVESPAEMRKSEITRILRKEAETLPEANAQIDLMAISALQLHAQAYGNVLQNKENSNP